MLPFANPDRLLEWASTAPWNKLIRFINNRGARGHTPATISRFIAIYETRRWAEEDKIRREIAAGKGQTVLSRRERIWAASERRLRRQQTLAELRALSPSDFELFVAGLFSDKGYRARATGGTGDGGIDVTIFDAGGTKWGIAQCKKYDTHVVVTAGAIRDFAGAYMVSGAKVGFYFTTGKLTKGAKKTAQRYAWLKVISGKELLDFIQEIRPSEDIKSPQRRDELPNAQ